MSDSEQWCIELTENLSREFADRPTVCTLASIDEVGLPSARSLICRRVEQTGELIFVSDARSRKNEHLAERPGAEVVFWLPGLRVQYRIAGSVGVVRAGMAEELRQSLWQELSDKTRAMFFWPAGGEPLDTDNSKFHQSISVEIKPPVTFELLILKPHEVDVVEVGVHPHRRRLFHHDGSSWSVRNLNP